MSEVNVQSVSQLKSLFDLKNTKIYENFILDDKK